MVFLGVRGNGTLFGYSKIQGGSLNSQRYHTLLQHTVPPEVRAGNGGTLDGLTWQQDGAPPHASDLNIHYLARQFGGRLVARRSEPFEGRGWAARSPDLNPLDYGKAWQFQNVKLQSYWFLKEVNWVFRNLGDSEKPTLLPPPSNLAAAKTPPWPRSCKACSRPSHVEVKLFGIFNWAMSISLRSC